MNALKIKKTGFLRKLARQGGLPSDGMVPDKTNLKYNRLLRAQYDANEISYDQMKGQQRDSERPVDFCDFTRFTLIGLIKWLVISLVVGAVGALVVGPMLGFIFACAKWALGYGWAVNKYQEAGGYAWGCALVVGSVVAFAMNRDEIFDFLLRPFERFKSKKSRQERQLEKAQAAYNRAEVAKAFLVTMKGKTCFKMEFVE